MRSYSKCLMPLEIALKTDLSTLEQQTMLAILRLHPKGYGVTIRDEIGQRTEREVSIGSIYAVLDRLQEKGFVESAHGNPTPQRGGRRKLYFTLTAPGQKTLSESLKAINAMSSG